MSSMYNSIRKKKDITCVACGYSGQDFHLIRNIDKNSGEYSVWASLSTGTKRRKCKLYGCPNCGTVKMEFEQLSVQDNSSTDIVKGV